MLILNLSLIFLSYIVYNLVDLGELFKKLEYKNEKNCKIVRGAIGFEDFHLFEDQYLIGGSNNNLKMFEMNYDTIAEVEKGNIAVFDTKNENFKIYQIINFPKDITFHPHGVYLYKNLLYVINHAYSLGGERIEVLKIEKNQGNK
jgi:hypothetical protein